MTSQNKDTIKIFDNYYLVCENGIIEGIYADLPEKFSNLPVDDFTDKLIIPAFSDLHLHAAQFYQRGVGMDKQLLEWLTSYTFPQESRFADREYAKRAYSAFAKELIRQGTFQASLFATIHYEASDLLFQLLDDIGVTAYVGPINMDANSPSYLSQSTKKSAEETERFLKEHQGGKNVKPIITPRFVPSCSLELMRALGDLAEKYNAPVQSHLCESHAEIALVKKLFPQFGNYAEVYRQTGLMGRSLSIMAHCVYLSEDEERVVRETGTVAVHCPDSNINVRSGIMPAKRMLDSEMCMALGSDIGGGHNLPVYKVMASAIQSSKLKTFETPEVAELSIENVFYMATRQGGTCFGKFGALEKGYRANILVIDDQNIPEMHLNPVQRLERFCYLGDDRNIVSRYLNGEILTIKEMM